MGRKLALGVAILAAVLSVLSGPVSAKDPIDIGMAVALTGPLSVNDSRFVNGAKLAVQKLNLGGGMDGHEIRLHILDNASNATTGVTVTNQLLNQFNVTAMLNGSSSAQNAAINPILARYKVPAIQSSQLPDGPAWEFLANFAYEKVVEQQVNFAKQEMHATKIAFLFSQTPYGQNAAKLMATLAPKAGLQIVFSEGAEGTSTDLTPQMAKIKDLQPDLVLDFLTGRVHIVEAKGAATVGLQVPIVMAPDDASTLRQGALAYAKSFCVASPVQAYPDIRDTNLKAAVEVFVTEAKKAGLDVESLNNASVGWDAANLLAQAVATSGTTSGEKLRAAIETAAYDGAMVRHKFSVNDHTGQVEAPNPMQIGQFRNGTLQIVFAGG